MMNVENICYHYSGYPEALRNICFQVNRGEFLAILGNNGVGKSTLLKCINRILAADSGSVMLGGENLRRMSSLEVAKRVAFVSQTIPNTQMTVYDMVMLGRRPYMRFGFTQEDHLIAQQVMERLQLGGEIKSRYLNELSGGERQKVMLARALAQQPKVLLLDEPTSSLDIRNQYQVLQMVLNICREDGLCAVMVIHDLNLALRFCDRFLLMRNGEVYKFGDISILDGIALKEVYDVEAKVVEFGGHHTVMVEN